jgi:acyl-homoserine-lactone acylase
VKKLVLVALVVTLAGCSGEAPVSPEVAAWQQRAANVEIIRDTWGIPHVYGKTDADTVFGVMYAQAEDDFHRVEQNYLLSMGRLAEAEGEREIWRDLRMKMFIDPEEIKGLYDESPEWLKELMQAWADGLNYYLHTHPEVTPRVITRFEPWMPLTFSEGSIGGDIERVNLAQLEAFYGDSDAPMLTADADLALPPAEPTGSNGIAIAPANTVNGHALLLINPHTSFYFRAEAKMVSEEGLNAYGAMTWGQFFIYQGFNDRAGWMHTSSSVDNIDEYLETIVRKGDGLYYVVGGEERRLAARTVTVPYRTDTGMADRTFTVYRTHRGPIVRQVDGQWVSVRLMEKPIDALVQSYGRTKAAGLDEYKKVMALHTNSSNNTIYADADGNIAYFHSNFVPRRDPSFDWSRPVDGSNPATEWGPLYTFDESPNAVNPPNGWIQNTNNWPYSAAGPHSPRREDFARYMDAGSENPRGIHAMRLLEGKRDFTLDGLIAAAYNNDLPAFDALVPALGRAWDRAPASDPFKDGLREQVALLRKWDRKWAVDSVETSLAIFWGEELWVMVAAAARDAGVTVYEYMERRATPQQLLQALTDAVQKLEADFGTWRTPWGEINRFQRLTGDIVQPFDDGRPSLPVGFTSGRWGSLASYGARATERTKKWYGTSGNSFVAVVEFGDRVRAKAITAGGQSGNPASPHFTDQAERYTTGHLRDVFFYRDELEGHIARRYQPGER